MKHIRQFMLMAALVLAALPADARECDGIADVVEERFKVSSGGTLELDLDAGDIDVRRGNAGAVVIRADRCASSREQLREHEMTAEKSGNNVEVVSRLGSDRGFSLFGRGRRSLRVVISAIIPSDYNIDFSTGAGNVVIRDAVGAVSGETGAGKLVLTSVRGPVEISTGSGNVELREILGQVDVQTGAGNVELRDVEGALSVQTGAGNVVAEIVRQPKSRTELQSGAGNVTVILAPSVRVDVEAVASVGSASTDFPLKVEGSWMTKSFEGSINGGGPDILMRSGVGNVALRRR
ncbi:MAG TPA: DUF4097 family beta strand repeat-containing protein [Rhodothermales bacterium]